MSNIAKRTRGYITENLKGGANDIVTTKNVDGEEIAVTRAEALSEVIWSLAMSGDQFAIKTLLDRLDGPVAKRVEEVSVDVASVRPENIRAMIEEFDRVDDGSE